MKLSNAFLKLIIIFIVVYWCVYKDVFPFNQLMTWRHKLETNNEKEVGYNTYLSYDFESKATGTDLSLEITSGKHFWYPQISVWIEDLNDNYIETLFITKATAKGNFYLGRTKDNFKEFDKESGFEKNSIARVDALPYWSHKRNHEYRDGFFTPHNLNPMPDAISGATPSGNFIINTSTSKKTQAFKIMLEINVAFDDNEYFSEYDFPNDSIYHSGTGQLGQPSLIYQAIVDTNDSNSYYVLKPIGHGHHSGLNGKLHTDLSTLTTALKIIERIIVKIEP